MHSFPLKPQTFFKVLRAHVSITCHQPRVPGDFRLLQNCLHQSLIFREVQPSEYQKYTAYTRKPPLTFTHACAILPPLPWTLAASAAKPPSFLGFFVELLLHILLPQSMLHSINGVTLFFVLSKFVSLFMFVLSSASGFFRFVRNGHLFAF